MTERFNGGLWLIIGAYLILWGDKLNKNPAQIGGLIICCLVAMAAARRLDQESNP